MGMSSTQKAAVSEGLAASLIIATSNGRLAPFAPVADDHGIDLLIFDKETGATVPVQVKSRLVAEGMESVVQFDVRKATLRRDALLLCIAVDPSTLGMRMSWLIPMGDVPELANNYPTKHALRPSQRPNSGDRYRRYGHADGESMIDELMLRLTRAG